MQDETKQEINVMRRALIGTAGAALFSPMVSTAARAQSASATSYVVPTSQEDLCFSSPRALAALIRQKKLSSVEVVSAFYDRIDAINPKINAICTLIPREDALELAKQADEAVSRGDELGALHGLPLAVKDTADVEGMVTTYGSPLLVDNVAAKDSIYVDRLRKAGTLFIGKTNVPEFAAGSHTYNDVYGITRNPYNLDKSAGGSSGGAGAALAAGLLPMADGSDMGGSLRNPGAFNNVIGYRPSIGRVPGIRSAGWQSVLATEGPMGRTARDTADLLAVMAGPDPRDPLSINEPGAVFIGDLSRGFAGAKVAWIGDQLEGVEFEKEVLDVCRDSLKHVREMGCTIEEAALDASEALDAFHVDRGFVFAELAKQIPRSEWSKVKEGVVWNFEYGLGLTIEDFLRGSDIRTRIYQNVIALLSQYDFIILPTTQVLPFDVEMDWVREINDKPMATTHHWMASCIVMTLTGLPSVSVPGGFSKDGLPVGLQVVGGFKKDFDLLQFTHAFEQVSGYGRQRPTFA
ncbi:amidase [Ruegeria sp. Ofav3-42]|uniref:amidase n=1 Tax=Ruegeria sp. Ofav3-42 TaxID=2917759 RepID=UPI001EF6DBE4|nr:amidase [Ruegeria sp. Ofav3-42]MCG7521953.1 amidase [Ruegeria sp. Ofav3-42]